MVVEEEEVVAEVEREEEEEEEEEEGREGTLEEVAMLSHELLKVAIA